MKKIIMLSLLVFLTFPTKVSAQTIEHNVSDTNTLKNETCYTMRIYNDGSEISEILASIEVKDEELASKIQVTVKNAEDIVYEGFLSELDQQRLGEVLIDESQDLHYCLETEEDLDLDAIHASLDWQVELEPIVSSASIEPEVEEVGQECITPYPSVNHLSMLPMGISKTGLVFAVGSFAAGFFLARRRR